jgi:hypothetical protein
MRVRRRVTGLGALGLVPVAGSVVLVVGVVGVEGAVEGGKGTAPVPRVKLGAAPVAVGS